MRSRARRPFGRHQSFLMKRTSEASSGGIALRDPGSMQAVRPMRQMRTDRGRRRALGNVKPDAEGMAPGFWAEEEVAWYESRRFGFQFRSGRDADWTPDAAVWGLSPPSPGSGPGGSAPRRSRRGPSRTGVPFRTR